MIRIHRLHYKSTGHYITIALFCMALPVLPMMYAKQIIEKNHIIKV